MVVNLETLLLYAPIKDMKTGKVPGTLASSGLGEAGYDIRLKQDILFYPSTGGSIKDGDGPVQQFEDRFVLASAIEEFQMPSNLVGIVHDKSTWARKRLSVFNTVIEPGWNGFLTLELVYHGQKELFLPAGTGIAQVIFHELANTAKYNGKYQNQGNEPVPAKHNQVTEDVCTVCYEYLMETPSGKVCKNGHGF